MSPTPYVPTDRDGLLEDLNPAQREAVTHPGGPLLVVAGAGTGKTRVLTRRVAWIVAGGIPARAVLAITFTNKAAEVMRSRLADTPRGAEVWAGTFHGFCAFLLRRLGDRIGVDPRFTILDRDDQHRLLKTLLGDLGLKDSGLKPRQAAEMIGRLKNAAHEGVELDLKAMGLEAAFDLLWKSYHERLRASGLLDFDDLLLEAVRLLREDEMARLAMHDRFAHVLVDEYQDTNAVQRELLLQLVGPSRNLTVVGDPDQSIYRWRGALVRNILEFEQDFPGARTIVLEQNYRSTGHILSAAEHVIEKNRERHAKRLFSERPEGELVTELRCASGDDEAEAVAERLAAWQRDGGNLSDVAVVYRVNSMSRSIEMSLRNRRIPYVVIAGVEFFQRREVKDMLAYARLVDNPRDEAAFLRIVNVPKRGVGETSLKKIRNAATMKGTSLLEATRSGDVAIRGRARAGLAAFIEVIEDLETMPRAPVAALIERIADSTGYRAALEDHPDEIERNRIENVNELIAFAKEFDRTDPDADLTTFLERASLVSDQDAYEADTGRASLMSVHAAKGLEFPMVIVTGAELGLFPHARSLEDEASFEEERRLFYVAMTRAMDRLVISHAAQRTTYMGREPRSASPYLKDVPADVLDVRDRRFGGGSFGGGSFGGGSTSGPAHDGSDWVGESSAETVTKREDQPFSVGDRVHHPYFGDGWLRSTSGRGAEARVTVDFDAHGTKQMLLRFAKLEKRT